MNKIGTYILKLLGISKTVKKIKEKIEKLRKHNAVNFYQDNVVLNGCFNVEELKTLIDYMEG